MKTTLTIQGTCEKPCKFRILLQQAAFAKRDILSTYFLKRTLRSSFYAG